MCCLLIARHQPVKFDGYGRCGSGEIKFLVVAEQD